MISHKCLNIDDALANTEDLLCSITVDGLELDTNEEIREFLNKEKDKGHKVLPMEKCKGFSFITGCPGHETKRECKYHEKICEIASRICEEEKCPHWCGVYTGCKAYIKARQIYENRK